MILRRFIRFISSWWFTVILLLCLCALYIYFTSGENPFEKWISFVFYRPFGLILYIGLLVNLISASTRIIYARLRNKEIIPESIKGMDTYIETPLSGHNSTETIAKWIKKRGFSADIKENSISSLKGKLSFLPGTLTRTGLIILMIAILFSTYLRKTEGEVLHEGEGGVFLGRKIHLVNIKSNVPDEFLQIGEKGTFRLNKVSASLSSSSKIYSISGGFPARIDGNYYRITHLGFHQPFSVKTSKTESIKKADLDIFPPGKTDIVALPSEDMFLTFTLKPERIIKKGLITGKVFNLKTLSYNVILQRGKNKDKSESIAIKPEETATVGGTNIALGKNSLLIKIQSVHDPALSCIYAGILITLAGMIFMLSRFFWYEKQICAVFTEDKVLIGYREEFYKKWGIMKLHKWKEELT